MLARANRLVSADDYRGVLRRGRRIGTEHTVVSILSTTMSTMGPGPARFGFIVTRKVGNAVNRNRVRRRMRAIARELVENGLVGADVVVRALPGSVAAPWNALHAELSSAVNRAVTTGGGD